MLRGVSTEELEGAFDRMQAIFNSMNSAERKNRDILDDNRERRIARGAGVSLNVVAAFIDHFDRMCEMLKAVKDMRWLQSHRSAAPWRDFRLPLPRTRGRGLG